MTPYDLYQRHPTTSGRLAVHHALDRMLGIPSPDYAAIDRLHELQYRDQLRREAAAKERP